MKKYSLIRKRIAEQAEIKGITLKDLCPKIGMSETGFYQMLNKESMKVTVLLTLCDYFNKTPNYFLGYDSDDKVQLKRDNAGTVDFNSSKNNLSDDTVKILSNIFGKLKEHNVKIAELEQRACEVELETKSFQENLLGLFDAKAKLSPVFKKFIDDRVKAIVSDNCIVNGIEKE